MDRLLNPLGHLPVLNETVIDLLVGYIRLLWLLLLDKSDASCFVFAGISLLVHLLEGLELLVCARDDFVQLLVRVHLFFILVVVGGVRFLNSAHDQVFELLLPVLITGLLAEATGLNDELVQILFVLRLVKDALLHS